MSRRLSSAMDQRDARNCIGGDDERIRTISFAALFLARREERTIRRSRAVNSIRSDSLATWINRDEEDKKK